MIDIFYVEYIEYILICEVATELTFWSLLVLKGGGGCK